MSHELCILSQRTPLPYYPNYSGRWSRWQVTSDSEHSPTIQADGKWV
jgi:hypothetical protein